MTTDEDRYAGWLLLVAAFVLAFTITVLLGSGTGWGAASAVLFGVRPAAGRW